MNIHVEVFVLCFYNTSFLCVIFHDSGHIFILFRIHLGAELLGHILRNAGVFSIVATPFYTLTDMCEGSSFSIASPTLALVLFYLKLQ